MDRLNSIGHPGSRHLMSGFQQTQADDLMTGVRPDVMGCAECPEQGHPVVLKGSTGMSGNQDEQARGMALIAAIMLSAILFFGYLIWSAAR